MQLYEIGLSTLLANQKGLAVTGQNIANASTKGYHRQRVELAARVAGARTPLSVGSGVEVTDITRMRAQFVERRITNSITELSQSQSTLDALSNLESLFAISETSLHGRLGSFFDAWNSLQANPQDLTLRHAAISRAADLGNEFNRVHGGLQETLLAVDDLIERDIERLNLLTAELATIERRVREDEARGVLSNEMLDRRDNVLQEISGLVDVRVVEHGVQRDVWLANGLIQVSTNAPQLATSYTADGVSIVISGTNEPVPIEKGSLGALLELRNSTLPDLTQDIVDFGRLLTRTINQRIATGVDSLGGGLSSLRSSFAVSDPALPLSQVLNDAAPAGELWINTIDTSTGETTLHSISIDPDVDSLNSVASKIDLIPGLHGRVDSSGRLVIDSDAGVRFDFSGRLDSAPDASLITGTSGVQLAGQYTGDSNDIWTATVTSGGNVGQTSPLTIEIRDGGGQLIKTIDAGLGYEAGQPIAVVDGVSIVLSAGTLNTNDEFPIAVVHDSDDSEWLSTLGMGGIFANETPGEISVRSELIESPELLRLSRTGSIADGGIAQDIYALRQAFEFQGGTSEQYVADLSARLGGQVVAEELHMQGLEDELIRLEEEQAATIGVDPNEEFIRLMEYQRGFQAGSRFLQTVEESLDEILRLIR
jgi:flagellar hook-associated protein FlgK